MPSASGYPVPFPIPWRKLALAPITTSRIRVLVNAALPGYSRIIEVEAWNP